MAPQHLPAAPVWLGADRICASWTFLSCKTIHHSAEGCSKTLAQILTPRIAHTPPLFTQVPFSLSLCVSLPLFPFPTICHFLPLHLPDVHLFSHLNILFFSPPLASSPASLQKASMHLNLSWTANSEWTDVVLCTAVDMYDTQATEPCHWCVGSVALRAGMVVSVITTCSSITYSTTAFQNHCLSEPSCILLHPFMCMCYCLCIVYLLEMSTSITVSLISSVHLIFVSRCVTLMQYNSLWYENYVYWL